MSQTDLDNQGFYKLSWLQRIGFGVGDLAQNLIYQVIAGHALFYYTDVYVIGGRGNKEIDPSAVTGTILLIARIIDVIWDPFVGAFVDKSNPKFGKYRSWLLFGGLPLTVIAILCFWSGVSDAGKIFSIAYAAVTYILLQMLYTVVNVPYGAINASLTRDTHEITVLTSVRMVCANIGGFFVWVLMPMFLSVIEGGKIPWGLIFFNFVGSIPGILFMPFVPKVKKLLGKKNMFYIFGVISIIGYGLLYFLSKSEDIVSNDPEKMEHNVWIVIANFIKAMGFTTITGYMWAIVPEVISYAEYTSGRRIAGIVNALCGMFFKAGNALGGAIPGYVLALTHYDPNKEPASGATMSNNRNSWFIIFAIYCVVGFVLLIFCFTQSKENIVMDEKETQNVKFTDLFVEFVRNGPLRTIALYFITAFFCMTCHNSSVSFLYKIGTQEKKAQEGIRWNVAIIPIILNIIMIIIISFYSLTDEKMLEVERENEKRLHKNDDLA